MCIRDSHVTVQRVAVAADINRQIRIGAKTAAQDEAQVRQRDGFLLQPDRARLVHGDVDHVRLVILRGLGG